MESAPESARALARHRRNASLPDSGNTSREHDRTDTTASKVAPLAVCRNMNRQPSLPAAREIDTRPILNPVSALRNLSRQGSRSATLFSCINSHADQFAKSASRLLHCHETSRMPNFGQSFVPKVCLAPFSIHIQK